MNQPRSRPIGYWLQHVHELLESTLDAQLAEQQLTRRHWQLLNTLARGPSTIGELDAALAPFVDDEHPTLQPLVEELAARGWLQRDGDGRWTLTADGADGHAAAQQRVQAYRVRTTEGIADEDYQRTVDTLARMAANLESME
jgi:hypothetical protein